jgi:hypothetical protein
MVTCGSNILFFWIIIASGFDEESREAVCVAASEGVSHAATFDESGGAVFLA